MINMVAQSANTSKNAISPILKDPKCFARPFLKWVGGKGQLLERLDESFPLQLKRGELDTYIEPFVGGGAVLFHITQRYSVSRIIIADTNPDLIATYRTIQKRPKQLAALLRDLEIEYIKLSEKQRSVFYYGVRQEFNSTRNIQGAVSIERAAQMIFLNKTCFNGLFRVNSSGAFNASFGKYVNPRICDQENLHRVSDVLKDVEILLGDFQKVHEFADENSFVYLDPPYRPLTETANFTGYSAETFTQLDQQRLAKFCKSLSRTQAFVLMSNSDPSNVNDGDLFFQRMYPGFRIEKTVANRAVNCKADRRGKISELMLMNY